MENSLICQLYNGEDNESVWVFTERTAEDIRQEHERAHRFYATLSREQRELYMEIQGDNGKQLAYQMEQQYRRGFRAGAKMMMEILTEDE